MRARFLVLVARDRRDARITKQIGLFPGRITRMRQQGPRIAFAEPRMCSRTARHCPRSRALGPVLDAVTEMSASAEYVTTPDAISGARSYTCKSWHDLCAWRGNHGLGISFGTLGHRPSCPRWRVVTAAACDWPVQEVPQNRRSERTRAVTSRESSIRVKLWYSSARHA